MSDVRPVEPEPHEYDDHQEDHGNPVFKAISGRVVLALRLLELGLVDEAIAVLSQLDRVLPRPDEVNIRAAMMCVDKEIAVGPTGDEPIH